MRATLPLLILLLSPLAAPAVTATFFDASQPTAPGPSTSNSDSLQSLGYQFKYSVDKYWSSYPGGPPTGRFFSVFWPAGLQAQAVTAGPNPGPASFTLTRLDHALFDLPHLQFKLLANTAGAGANLEIMPLLNGEDAFLNPLALGATGYGGQSFSYDTPTLSQFDTYKLSLYVDFAITSITLVDASLPPHLPGDTNADGVVDLQDLNNVLNNFGSTTPGTPGDENNDNVIDLQDLNNVLNNFGAANPPAPLPLPEPSSLSSILYSLSSLLFLRPRALKHPTM